MTRATWIVVAAVTLARAFAAWKLPLTGDEAYYWEWSRHLQLGYADHPPMVAYLIALTGWIGQPFAVRIMMLICGVVATAAAAAAASMLAGDRRAGMATALAMTLPPMLSVGFTIATPDAPLMAGWAVALYATVRFERTQARRDALLLGTALAFALLSKMFAWALVFGIAAWAIAPQRRSLWRAGLGVAFGLAAVLYVPYLIWNVEMNWLGFRFALSQRHEAKPSWYRPFSWLVADAAAYLPGLWIAALACAVRPRSALLAWTSIPLLIVLIVLNLHEPVELHWVYGPFVSLAVAIGLAYVHVTHRAKVVWAAATIVPAAILVPILFLAVVIPGQLYMTFTGTGSTLRNSGPFEAFTFYPLARDVRSLADANNAVVVTDGYGFSSLLDFNAGVAPVLVGYNHQGQELLHYYDPDEHPQRILFVDKEPLAPRPGHPEDKDGRPDFQRRLAAACGAVRPAANYAYSYRDPSGREVPARTYFLTWCDDPRPAALRILRWERDVVATR